MRICVLGCLGASVLYVALPRADASHSALGRQCADSAMVFSQLEAAHPHTLLRVPRSASRMKLMTSRARCSL
jgi:hypothetical protein